MIQGLRHVKVSNGFLVTEPKLEQIEPKIAKLFCKSLAVDEHVQNSLDITEAKCHLAKPVCWSNIGLEKLICDLKPGQ